MIITCPKGGTGKMFHNSLHFPFLKSSRALLAREASFPARTSSANCLSHLAASNLWNQVRNSANYLGGKPDTTFSISLILIIIAPSYLLILKASISYSNITITNKIYQNGRVHPKPRPRRRWLQLFCG